LEDKRLRDQIPSKKGKQRAIAFFYGHLRAGFAVKDHPKVVGAVSGWASLLSRY
jgi:hypothetical protein